jgi:hypothetical protein
VRLTQKRTCFGCKAFLRHKISITEKCELGFITTKPFNVSPEICPAKHVPCLKPMTNKDYMSLVTGTNPNFLINRDYHIIKNQG